MLPNICERRQNGGVVKSRFGNSAQSLTRCGNLVLKKSLVPSSKSENDDSNKFRQLSWRLNEVIDVQCRASNLKYNDQLMLAILILWPTESNALLILKFVYQ